MNYFKQVPAFVHAPRRKHCVFLSYPYTRDMSLKQPTLALEILPEDVTQIEANALNFFQRHSAELTMDHNGTAIEDALGQIPHEILEHYYGHGITRRTLQDQLIAIFVIAETHLLAGDTAPMTNQYIAPYSSGSAFVLSKKNKKLVMDGDSEHTYSRDLISSSGEKRFAFGVDIGTIVLNEILYPVADELKALYPETLIIRADELPALLERWES